MGGLGGGLNGGRAVSDPYDFDLGDDPIVSKGSKKGGNKGGKKAGTDKGRTTSKGATVVDRGKETSAQSRADQLVSRYTGKSSANQHTKQSMFSISSHDSESDMDSLDSLSDGHAGKPPAVARAGKATVVTARPSTVGASSAATSSTSAASYAKAATTKPVTGASGCGNGRVSCRCGERLNRVAGVGYSIDCSQRLAPVPRQRQLLQRLWSLPSRLPHQCIPYGRLDTHPPYRQPMMRVVSWKTSLLWRRISRTRSPAMTTTPSRPHQCRPSHLLRRASQHRPSQR